MLGNDVRVRLGSGLAVLLMACLLTGGVAHASTLVDQTALSGDDLFSTLGFSAKLPVFGPGYNADFKRVDALQHPLLEVTMKEVDQEVLPGFDPTRVWAYEVRDAITKRLLGPAHWPAVTIEARRFVPTFVKYVNELPSFADGGLVQGLMTVDQTIHWANPLGNTSMQNCMDGMWNDECGNPYTGPVPTVSHLHGGETRSSFDGGPEQWFTPDGKYGKDYATLDHPGPGKAIYLYDNFQEPGTLWFHDHALGATRDSVYGGLASFYFIDAPETEPHNLPDGAYDIELLFQDRQFDTNGQLFFPDADGPAALNGGPPNPNIHPFWIPEFIGDVPVVNGAPWPHLDVEPRRYMFRLLDGANARFFDLQFLDEAGNSVPVYVVGRDDAYMDAPVPVQSVLFAPGQRLYVVVDFSGLKGHTITVMNTAPVPFPDGLVPGVGFDQPSMGSIMQFNVTVPLKGRRDNSCNPAAGGCGRLWYAKTVRLTDGQGHLAPQTKINKVRQLVLKEVVGFDSEGNETGPLEVLLNNTKWNGLVSPGIAGVFPIDGVSELPQVGSTEMWEIINLTADAHPIHTHLIQFQILNRQQFNVDQYNLDWAAAFPGSSTLKCDPGVLCPGYGPPNPYNVANADGALGGNLPLRSDGYLIDPDTGSEFPARPPAAEETGWVDTAIVMPGEVMRIIGRWAPTSTPAGLPRPGRNFYSFDPTEGPGYVWHCHILDHEDNEMMRPYKVVN